MSQVISRGFDTKYEIVEVGSIKPGGSGTMEGRPYNASVKFRSRNVVERMDERVGVQEVETTIEFKIICENEEEVKLVSEAIRKLRVIKTPFYISGDLPRKYQGGDVFMVDSFDHGVAFLKSVESALQARTVQKVN